MFSFLLLQCTTFIMGIASGCAIEQCVQIYDEYERQCAEVTEPPPPYAEAAQGLDAEAAQVAPKPTYPPSPIIVSRLEKIADSPLPLHPANKVTFLYPPTR